MGSLFETSSTQPFNIKTRTNGYEVATGGRGIIHGIPGEFGLKRSELGLLSPALSAASDGPTVSIHFLMTELRTTAGPLAM